MNADRTSTASGSLRAAVKIAVLVLLSAMMMPMQWLVLRITRGHRAFVLPRLWHRCLCAAFGIQADVVGRPLAATRTLYVGNHLSHFDILLLGSLLQARFIAKDDMERWPGMRFVGGLGQTLFISRRTRDANKVASTIAAQMRSNNNLILFAEGTTSSGVAVAPFKSSLFSLFMNGRADGGAWTVQPFTLDIVAVDGRAVSTGGARDDYAFYGDMDAGAHVRRFLRLSGARVRVVFHAPITIAPESDRKTLAAQLHAVVASGLAQGGLEPCAGANLRTA